MTEEMLRSIYQLASGDFELADDIYGLCIEKPIGFESLVLPRGLVRKALLEADARKRWRLLDRAVRSAELACRDKSGVFAQPRCLIFHQGYKPRGWEVFRDKVVIEKVRRELDLNIEDIYIGGRL
jgi:hypothetical protein